VATADGKKAPSPDLLDRPMNDALPQALKHHLNQTVHSGFSPDALQCEIVHSDERAKLLWEWLLGLDSNQQPSG
jgi:hypothetical protein